MIVVVLLIPIVPRVFLFNAFTGKVPGHFQNLFSEKCVSLHCKETQEWLSPGTLPRILKEASESLGSLFTMGREMLVGGRI